MSSLAPVPVTTAPPLVERLAEASTWVSADTLASFAGEAGDGVLFIWSDPVRFPEVLDVAVVLPELQKHFSAGGVPRFRIGVVDAASEDAVAQRYGAQRRPALVFVREGQYVDTVDGMLDWDVYVERLTHTLALPPRRAPSVGIPVVNAGASSSSCH